MTRNVKSHRAVLESLGLTIIDERVTGGAHIAFTVRLKTLTGDHEKTFIAPNTPSDHRGIRNWEAQARRWVRSKV